MPSVITSCISSVVHRSVGIAVCVALSSCQARDSIRPLPSGMIVLPRAQDVTDLYQGQVRYKLRDPYPGTRSIDDVHRRLKEQGWRRRNRDFLNPDLTVDITARWRGPIRSDEGDFLVWSEQWENPVGDVVAYGFTYAVVGANPDPNTPLEVFIAYFDEETVRRKEREN
jgi:hypothetical protein